MPVHFRIELRCIISSCYSILISSRIESHWRLTVLPMSPFFYFLELVFGSLINHFVARGSHKLVHNTFKVPLALDLKGEIPTGGSRGVSPFTKDWLDGIVQDLESVDGSIS
jgi:hypothetical protein